MPHPYPHTVDGACARVLDAGRGALPAYVDPYAPGARQRLAEQAAYLAALQIRFTEVADEVGVALADVQRRRALSEAADAA